MTDESTGAVPESLDEQDRIAILQLLTLTDDQRLDYFADEVDFDAEADQVAWVDG
jgi:hypothetical protein